MSVIALFSWVMRKDGGADEEELDVAQLYFEKHPAFNRIQRLFPNGLEKDPITGAEHISVNNCMQMLKFYNACPRMLRYGKCCSNILASGLYYSSALDLMKALLQVAYTIDGVIEPEWEILRGIAQELKILKIGISYLGDVTLAATNTVTIKALGSMPTIDYLRFIPKA